MAFDACMMRAVIEETRRQFIGAKIEKVLQPSADEIALVLHQGRTSRRLAFNLGPSGARMQLSDIAKENPKQAPMFCMLLRKYLVGARLLEVSQLGFDRIAVISVQGYDEMGFAREIKIICEIMGKYANLVLCDSEDKVLCALKIIDFAASSVRQILPGLKYQVPDAPSKITPHLVTRAEFFDAFYAYNQEKKGEKFITDTFSGTATQIARELCCRAGCQDTAVKLIEPEGLWAIISEWQGVLSEHRYTPCAVFDDAGVARDYSYMDITYLGDGVKRVYYNSLGELFDAYFKEKDRLDSIRSRARDLINLTESSIARTERKLEIQRETLFESEKGFEYKHKGDLITANLYRLKRGDGMLECDDYYSEGCPRVKIELDTRLSPAQNAQKLYKLYNKCKTAKEVLAVQIERWERELEYLFGVRAFIDRAECEDDLNEIREELYNAGYGARMRGYKPQKQIKSRPHSFKTSGGFTLLVGRNNLQNDNLTLRIAEKQDIWFHTKGHPGSHVVLKTEGQEPSERDYTEACEIAAYYSQAGGDNVAVDYTRVKNIKKPQGARAGFVTYKTNYTAYVNRPQNLDGYKRG